MSTKETKVDEQELKAAWVRLHQNWLLLVRSHYQNFNLNELELADQMNHDFWKIGRKLGQKTSCSCKQCEWQKEPGLDQANWEALK